MKIESLYLMAVVSVILGLVTSLFIPMGIVSVAIIVLFFGLALFLVLKVKGGVKMLQKHKKEFTNLVLIISLAFFASGCAIGTTRVNVSHDPLDRIENKKEGNIFVKQFVDKRKNPKYIGNKRNMYGMVLGHIGTKEGVKLEELLTNNFTEALKEAGYNPVIQEPQSGEMSSQVKFDAIVDGEIIEFWLDLYMAVWHKVGVKVKAIDPINQNVLWEKDILGSQKNVLWAGVTAEYEKVIREALTKALNQAAKEFASDEFYKVIRK